MLYAVIKALLSGIVIAAASEVAKRSPAIGAIILSLPLISILAFIWLWRDTSDTGAIAALSQSHLLVRAADPSDVPGPAGAAAGRGWLLGGTWLVLCFDLRALRGDGVDAGKARRFLVTGGKSGRY